MFVEVGHYDAKNLEMREVCIKLENRPAFGLCSTSERCDTREAFER